MTIISLAAFICVDSSEGEKYCRGKHGTLSEKVCLCRCRCFLIHHFGLRCIFKTISRHTLHCSVSSLLSDWIHRLQQGEPWIRASAWRAPNDGTWREPRASFQRQQLGGGVRVSFQPWPHIRCTATNNAAAEKGHRHPPVRRLRPPPQYHHRGKYP